MKNNKTEEIKRLQKYVKQLWQIVFNQYYTITALERDQYEVLWSRVQQYWTRRMLHKNSYWSSSSVVIVLLHKALFYYNFVLFENFIILKKIENFEILWNFSVLKFYENFDLF
jgi:uncharacterized protein YcaQ